MPRGAVLPLTAAQTELWYRCEEAPDGAVFNVAGYYDIRGPLDPELWTAAVRRVVREAESLRVRFEVVDAEPRQVVEPAGLDVEVVNLAGEPEPEAVAEERMWADIRTPFDRFVPLVPRCVLFRLGVGHWRFFMCTHHIVTDGFSHGVLFRRLTDVYDALVSGRPADEGALEPLSVLVEDDMAYHGGSAQFVTDRALWRDRFPRTPELVNLSSRAPVPAAGVVRRSAVLARPDAGRLKEVAWQARVALPEMIVAATAAYVQRKTGSPDVLLTLLTTARRGAAARNVPGMVANSLPLPVSVRPGMTRSDLLRHAAGEVRRTLRHQRYRSRLVRGHMGLPGDVRPFGPTVNILGLGAKRSFGGCVATPHELSTGPVDGIEFIASETPGGELSVNVLANPALYSGDDLGDLLGEFVGFLAEFGTPVEDRLPARIDAGPAPGWGIGEQAPPPAGLEGLLERIEAAAVAGPEAVAVVGDDGSWSYGRLWDLARRVGNGLAGAGAAAESVVGVVADTGGVFAGTILGVWCAGGAYVPVDPTAPFDRIAAQLADCGAGFLVTTRMWRDKADELVARVPRLRTIVAEDTPDPGDFRYLPRHAGSAAYVGGAERVVVSDGGLLNHLWARIDALGITAVDTVLQNAPFTSGGAAWQLFAALAAGGQVRVAEPGAFFRDGATVAEVTPGILGAALDGEELELPGLRQVVVTGEALPVDLRDRWQARYPRIGLSVEYGLTECSGSVTHTAVPAGGSGAVPIGRPVRNTRLSVLGPDLRPVPPGVAGELYVGGEGVARGFAGKTGATAVRWVADPSGPPGARMVRTGDRARWTRSGDLEYLGRVTDPAVLGVRPDLGAIGVALRELDGVRDALAVVRPDQEGQVFLVGYVVPAGVPGEAVLPAARAAMIKGLPSVVASVTLVLTLDRIPLDRGGKVAHHLLPAPRRPAAPGDNPRDEREEVLAELFADILGRTGPGVGESFFDLGGHSLLAIRLVRRIRSVFGVELPVSAVFEAPTVAALAEVIAEGGGPARPALRPVDRSDRVPLSYAQQRLWFLEEFGKAGSAYHVPVLVRLSGMVDTAALRAALGDVIARHESLRTVFPVQDGTPYQHVFAAEEALQRLTFDVVPVAEADFDAAAAVAVQRPFALTLDLPVRARLFSFTTEDHVLLLVMHHIAGDAMSWAPAWRDLTTAYETRARGEIPAPAELPAQYADFAVWQREMLGSKSDPGSVLGRQLEFWRATLAGAPEELVLPTDRPRPAQPSLAGGRVPLVVDAELHQALAESARRAGASVFMVVQAALATLLSKLGAGDDIPIGTASAGRADPALDELVGFFVNTVVLRTDMSGDPSFEELLARVRDADLAAFAHDDVPFELVVDAVNPARSLTTNPLFQVVLVSRESADRTSELAGVTATVEELHTGTAKFDLLVDYAESFDGREPAGIAGALEYSADLFDRDTAELLAGRLVRILAAVVAEPGRAISEIDVMDAAERRRVVTEWNDTAHPVPAVTVPELFAAQAAATPDAPAVVFEGETVTYAELSARADALAGVLADGGAGPDRVVAILLPRSVELVVALVAVTRSGAAFLPVDPDYPDERIAYLLEDAAPVLTVTDAATASRIPATAGTPVVLDPELTSPREVPKVRPQATSAAYVLYTSGSTGRPKGVVVSHAALANRVLWMQDTYRLSAANRVLQKTSCGFDVSVWEFFWPLITGATLVVARPDGHRDPWYLAEVIRRAGVTDLHFVPSMLREFLREADPANCTSVRRVYCSGEALTPALREEFHAKLGAELHNLYGPTEAAIDVTAWASPRDRALPVVPIGRPVWNTRLYVLDDRLRPVAPGVPGELYLAGAQLGRGYLNRPGLTAERFVACPFGEGERMYRTGDRARWNRKGEIEYLGRADHQVKVRGVRIEPGEIEAVLGGHDSVAGAVVLALPGSADDHELVAYVVAAPGRDCDTEVLRAHVAAELPAAMVPAAFVPLAAVPLTAHGKLDRAALPPPDRGGGAPGRAPRTEEECLLCVLFAEVLDVPEVGVDDDFFRLGGHSLTATRLVGRIRSVLDVDITVQSVFRAPTPAGLSRVLTGQTAEPPARWELPGSELAAHAERRLAGLAADIGVPTRTVLQAVRTILTAKLGFGEGVVPLPGDLTIRELIRRTAQQDSVDDPQDPFAALGHDAGRPGPAGAAELRRCIEAAVDGVLANPDGLAVRLELAAEPGWRSSGGEEVTTTLVELWEAQARVSAERIAVTCGDDEVTYQELDARANRLAHALIDRGVGAEQLVALLLPRSVDLVVAVLAVLKAGAAYLPLDPDYPAGHVDHVLGDASPSLVISTGPVDTGLPCLRLDAGDLAAHPPTAPHRPILPGQLAYAIYTSGSTGRSKGVLVSHGNVTRLFASTAHWFRFGPDQVWSLFHSYAFDFSVWELWGALLHGGRLVVVPRDTARSPRDFRRLLVEERVTTVSQTPSAFLQFASHDADTGGELPVRTLIFGGEALEPPRLADWFRRRGDEAPRLVNMYGITETTVHVTYRELREEATESQASPIGVPIPDLRVFVLDRGLRPVPTGIPGELYVSGPGLARGYLGRPGLTAGRFVACPFAAPGQRMYRTGDVARWTKSGELEFVGRADDQVKIRGLRVEPGEIESVLAEHDAVGQVFVGLEKDQREDARLVAYLVPAGRRGLEPGELRAWAAARLPAHLVPAAFVVLDRLPLTPQGKLDRRALPGPVFEAGRGRLPVTPAEKALCDLFADVLGVERVSPDDGFFALGGNSLLAAKLVARIRSGFGADLSVQAVFEDQTVAGLLRLIGEDAVGSSVRSPAWASRPRPDEVPLSLAQERIWVEHQLSGASPVYNIPAAAKLSGHLDRAALQAALEDVVGRHESLRTVIQERNGVPRQVVRDQVRPDLVVIEVSAENVDAAVATHAREPFDLGADLPLRCRLLALGETEHVLLLVVHHIAADGWSLDPLAHDLSRAYAARVRGQAPEWEPLPVQYADHVLRQRELLDGDGLHEQLEFWRDTLAGLPEQQLPLLADRPRPAEPSHRGDVVEFTVGAELHRGIANLAAAAGVTEFMVVHAALAALMGKLGAGTDILVGTPVWGRGDAALDDLVGLFANTVVLRVDVSGRPTFRELLGRVREADVAALAHQDIPFAKVAGGRRPFGVLLAFQTTAVPRLELPGLTAEITPIGTGTAKFDLSFALASRRGGGMQGYLEFSTDLFDRSTAEALAARLVRLLAGAVAAPDAVAGGIDVLDPAERAGVLAASRGRVRSLPGATLPELFAAKAAECDGRTAVRYEGAEISYRELDERSNRLAHALIGEGAGPERVVALLMPPSIDLVVALLAVLKSGAAYLTVDPDYPAERITHLLDSARPAVVLTPESIPAAASAAPATAPEVALRPDQAAYVVFTSGSTGTPKGVVVEHRNVVALVSDHIERFGLDHTTRVLQFAPLGFDAASGEILATLLSGGVLVLVPAAQRIPGEPLARLVAATRANFVVLPPTALATLPPGALPEGITLVSAGEECPPELAGRWATGRRMVNAYGPTETTVTVTITGPLTAGARPTIGRPLANTTAHLLDEWLSPVPPGVPGELYLGGAQVSRGYLDQPAQTASRFVADPFGPPGARLYRSGDLAVWTAEGTLSYRGRADDQVKIRGFRVEPGEVEAVLAGHPAVRQATVQLREDQPGRRQLVAYYVGDDVPLREYLRRRLPEHMVPAAVVRLDAFPRTPHGKLDRGALPAPRFERGPTEPRSDVERVLCTVLAEVLGLESVGAGDSFFDLGGDSIVALQVVSKARHAGWALRPRDVLLAGTAAEMAKVAAPASEAEQPALDPVGSVEDTPMFAWLRGNAGPSTGFNQSMLVQAPAEMSLSQLHAVLAAVIDHHDALRLRQAEGGHLEIRPVGSVPVRLERVDVAGLGPDEVPAEVARWGDAARAALDPEAGELVRAVWFQAGTAERGRLMLVVHHLAVDGVSWRILLDDLATAWAAVRAGGVPVLEPVGTSLRQWARLLAARVPAVAADVDRWADVTREAGPWLGRPIESARDTFATLGRLRLDLPAEKLAADAKNTLEILLAALALSSAGFRRRRRDHGTALTVTLEGHGRDQFADGVDLSRTVGWFTSMYPVRLDSGPLGGTRPWADSRAVADVLRRTQEQLRALPSDRLGYGLLRFLHPEHGPVLGALPAPQVVFNYLGRYAVGTPGDWTVAPEPSPVPEADPGMAVPAVLTVNAAIEDGPRGPRLVAHWGWARGALADEDAHDLAESWAAAVATLSTLDESGTEPAFFELAHGELDELAGGLDWEETP